MKILNRIPKAFSIKSIIEENELVKTFVFEGGMGASPGQFFMVWIPGLDEKPISVALDTGKEIWLTVAAVGPFSSGMHKLKVGDKVGLRGPFGQSFKCAKNQHLAFLAGGYGAAPLYFFAHEAVKSGAKIEFIVGARSKNLLLYTERIPNLPGVNLHISTDDGSAGHHGYNTQILDSLLNEHKLDAVYAVGPEIMMLKGAMAAQAKNVKAYVSVERYMKCGFGICGNCVVDGLGEPMCLKGPVMDYEDVKHIEDFGKYHRDALGRKHYF